MEKREPQLKNLTMEFSLPFWVILYLIAGWWTSPPTCQRMLHLQWNSQDPSSTCSGFTCLSLFFLTKMAKGFFPGQVMPT